MSDTVSDGFSADLLDDFFAECDEHLTQVRTLVASLDVAGGVGGRNGAALQALYARLHSIKGNCAIVGLTGAEQLAHAAEDAVRAFGRVERPLTPEAAATLARVGTRLAEMVNAFRLRAAPPPAADLIAALGVATPGETGVAVAPDRRAEESALAGGTAAAQARRIRRASFTPSAELDRRGININAVRERLSRAGEIVSAVPSVVQGVVSFRFVVAVNADIDVGTWQADGVEWEPEESVEAAVPADAAKDERAAEAGAAVMSLTPSHIVRVDLSRLDDLMRITGDLVIHHSRLQQQLQDGAPADAADASVALARSLREMRLALKRVRMVAVGEIFSRLPYVLRDLAAETGKEIDLVVEGRETEIDKFLVERLKEPLLHLVRNAVSHGIESPAERRAAGKPVPATLRLRAAAAGEMVRIEVADDGRGIVAEQVSARARRLGLPVPDDCDDAALLALICQPGFSTAEQADRVSGRGVGMAVVADALRELGGQLSLETAPGVGTKFILRLPLTLSITEALLVSTAAQTCAVPQAFVEEIVQVPLTDVRVINRVEVMPYRGGLLPLVRLSRAFGEADTTQECATVLVIGTERGSAGLLVGSVHGQREIVVRPLVDPLVRVPGVSGATELGDGKPVLILDPATLTRGAVRPRPAAKPAPQEITT